jgi:hypothetical protein
VQIVEDSVAWGGGSRSGTTDGTLGVASDRELDRQQERVEDLARKATRMLSH